MRSLMRLLPDSAGRQYVVSIGPTGLRDVQTFPKEEFVIGNIGFPELLALLAALIIPIWVGRSIGRAVNDEPRRVIGGVALLSGVAITFYGITRLNSTASQLASAAGGMATVAWAAAAIGVMVAVFGITALATKRKEQGEVRRESGDQAAVASAVLDVNQRAPRDERKCPWCAEVILTEAKVCKHCGRDIPAIAS